MASIKTLVFWIKAPLTNNEQPYSRMFSFLRSSCLSRAEQVCIRASSVCVCVCGISVLSSSHSVRKQTVPSQALRGGGQMKSDWFIVLDAKKKKKKPYVY